MSGHDIAIVAIAALATAGILVRPWRWPEAIWACSGAAILVVAGLLSPAPAWAAVLRGGDVYLFLTGMMLLSELARREGVFDWLAMHAVGWARGSSLRLFTLVYIIGVGVTALLSNDATAVVMTPAVFAVARKAKADPLPALLACAMVANAASFILPISNPANLVLYDGRMPPLGDWLAAFAAPSAAAVIVTYLALRWVERDRLTAPCATTVQPIALRGGGRLAFGAILATAILLLTMSAFDRPLGLPTFGAGAVTAVLVFARRPREAWPTLRDVSWGVLPLVAGLFVLVAGLQQAGVIAALADWLAGASGRAPATTAAIAGGAVAFGSNVVNNLPAGLIASQAAAAAYPPAVVVDALLIGVDLGPNLSITGSLATILWLAAIRREGEDVTFWRFLKVGALVMPPALVASLGARLLVG